MFASEGERETRDTMRVQAGNSSSAEQTLAWKGSVIRKMEEVESEKIIPSRPTGSFFAFNTQTPEAENIYLACGLNSIGILTGGGIGKCLAEWVLKGYPTMDNDTYILFQDSLQLVLHDNVVFVDMIGNVQV